MSSDDIDILMITYNRPAYTQLSLTRLLETCDEHMRVWLWHNGDHSETLELVKSLADHPRVYKFHHSRENKKLWEPTNWFWSNAKGGYLGKVDDDCIVPEGWAQKLRKAHQDVSEFGVIGCWHYPSEDFIEIDASKKIRSFTGGHRLMVNCWIGGSGYLMKRACLQEQGLLTKGQSFTDYCIRLALKGSINGWYFPFLYQEHMDDPRSPHTILHTDKDMALHMPLTAKTFGVDSVVNWTDALRQDAFRLQRASTDPRLYIGWRRRIRNMSQRLRKAKKNWS